MSARPDWHAVEAAGWALLKHVEETLPPDGGIYVEFLPLEKRKLYLSAYGSVARFLEKLQRLYYTAGAADDLRATDPAQAKDMDHLFERMTGVLKRTIETVKITDDGQFLTDLPGAVYDEARKVWAAASVGIPVVLVVVIVVALVLVSRK